MTDEELRTLVVSLAASTASNTEAVKALTTTAESQARSIELMREGISFNTQTMANALELSALSQRTAAEALQLSANTSRNIDRLERNTNRTENNIDRLEQMVEIIIKDNQADRARISGLEGQG